MADLKLKRLKQQVADCIHRALCLLAEVRKEEGVTVLAMFTAVFLLLTSYYLVKPAREGWLAVSFVHGLSKMEVKAYSSFAQAIALVGVVSAYQRVAARWPRRKLVTGVNLFLAINMGLFWLLQPGLIWDSVAGVGIVFYLWVGIFGVLVVSQFWAFAADLYSYEGGKRLLPVIAVGAAAGGMVGSWLSDWLPKRAVSSTYDSVLIAALPLLLATLLVRYAETRGPAGLGTPSLFRLSQSASPDGEKALTLILRHRYLTTTAILVLLLTWVSTSGDNVLYGAVQEAIGAKLAAAGVTDPTVIREAVADGTTAFYGQLYFWVNLCTLLMQSFLASRILKWGGFAAVLMMLPVVALMSYSLMAAVPVLAVIKLSKIAENSTNYSIQNTARHVLWLPAAPEMIYKAKPAIDTLCVRFGDGLAALTALVGLRVLDLSFTGFFVLNVGLLVVSLPIAWIVIREHGRLARQNPYAR